MTQVSAEATPGKSRRARQESNQKFATDGSYESVENLLHQLAIKCHARVKSMGINLEYNDVFQEMNLSYVKALKAWKPDGGSLFSTYCRTACLNNFNKAIERIETERRELGMTSVHVLVTSDDGGAIDPMDVLGADFAPESDSPAHRLEASQEMKARLDKLTGNARRLVALLLHSEQDRDPGAKLSLRDICRKMNLSADELKRLKLEILQVYGVKWN